mmetsp:Transcript_93454/g.179803  ORF Transcript_93454/g.179803 Transcript_93454/m.179803 type:complete len:336 (+) Transcript_93454:592-1599(+)
MLRWAHHHGAGHGPHLSSALPHAEGHSLRPSQALLRGDAQRRQESSTHLHAEGRGRKPLQARLQGARRQIDAGRCLSWVHLRGVQHRRDRGPQANSARHRDEPHLPEEDHQLTRPHLHGQQEDHAHRIPAPLRRLLPPRHHPRPTQQLRRQLRSCSRPSVGVAWQHHRHQRSRPHRSRYSKYQRSRPHLSRWAAVATTRVHFVLESLMGMARVAGLMDEFMRANSNWGGCMVKGACSMLMVGHMKALSWMGSLKAWASSAAWTAPYTRESLSQAGGTAMEDRFLQMIESTRGSLKRGSHTGTDALCPALAIYFTRASSRAAELQLARACRPVPCL